MNKSDNVTNSPWQSLVILLGLTLVCAIGVQLMVLFIAMFFSGNLSFLLNDGIGINFKQNPIFSYSMIIASSFGTFLLPSLILQRIEPQQEYFPNHNGKNIILFVLTALFMIAFSPAMQLFSEWNMQMSLPEALKGMEVWMREKEDSMAELTQSMVMVDTWQLMFINLFAVAVMPAIAEEYFFRGALMKIIQRMIGNYHLSIWLTAIIFSAIHVQFFGFIPRMLLGAFFGYMLFWTKNIWIPILGHFINNGAAVVLAFYYTRQGKTYQELQSHEAYSLFVYLASFIGSALIGWYFYKKTKQINNINGEGLD